MSTSKPSRVIDADVGRLRGLLGPLERDGRIEEAEEVRRDLAVAVFFARLRKISASAPPLSDQQVVEATRILSGALTGDEA